MTNAIDAKLLEVISKSTCFGIAYDPTVPECKQCDVKGSCKAKMEGGLGGTPIPTTKAVAIEPAKKATTTTTTTSKASTPKNGNKPKATTKKDAPKPANPNMPDFKPMSLPELKDLAKERSVEWKDYDNDNITRMRLIMALKKSY